MPHPEPLEKTILHGWVAQKTGLAEPFTAESLARWQHQKAHDTVRRALRLSPFYRQHLAGARLDMPPGPAFLQSLPFTTAAYITEEGGQMLCTPESEIARVRTIRSSASTGPAKRVGFTEEDLERTRDFFATGMQAMAAPGDVVAIFMSDTKPGSMATLLCEGLARFGAVGLVHGPLGSLQGALATAQKAQCYVGLPADMLYLCRKAPQLRPKTVLLTADYTPRALEQAVRETWACRTFTHYGLTEAAYGLAVQCPAHSGMHTRAADFLVEVIHPETGRVQPPGADGEIVLTSLAESALPLVRYRTGDVASLLPAPCACGSFLPALGPVRGRVQNLRQPLNIHRLDDLLFAHPGLAGYTARRAGGTLELTVDGTAPDPATLSALLVHPVRLHFAPLDISRQAKRQIAEE